MSTKRSSGTKEWASHNVNCCLGCSNACLYCYAREMALRYGRIKNGDEWATEVVNKKAVGEERKLLDGTVMFPTTHDITPGNLDACIIVLKKLLEAGNHVLIVSKPRREIIDLLCHLFQDFKNQILFRFTIGVREKGLSEFWEPGAPCFIERIQSLVIAYDEGFKSSVSMEPLLEPWNIRSLVGYVQGTVTDSIWIGSANKLRQRTGWTLPGDHPEILRLLEWQTPEQMREIYEQLKGNPKIRWKDSYKKALGLELPEKAGMDI